MPEIQELALQAPDMMHDHFYLTKTSKDFQPWEEIIIAGDELEFFSQDSQQWIKATVASSYIDDGSGNAPGANAHYSLQWTDGLNAWQYTLHDGLRIRFSAPTDDEMKQRNWCQGADWTGGWHEPQTPVYCHEKGQRYTAPSGQAYWYCEKHALTTDQWTFALDELHRDFNIPLDAMRVKRIDSQPGNDLLWHVLIEMDKQYHEYIPAKCSVLVSMRNGQFLRENVGEWGTE